MKRTTTKKGLVLAGIALTGMVYTPAAKPIPSKEVIAKYISPSGKYNAEASEARKKEILNNIRNLKQQMRDMVDKKIEEDSEKLCTTLLQEMKSKVDRMVEKRAKELKVHPKYIKAEQLCKKKGIILLHLEDIA